MIGTTLHSGYISYCKYDALTEWYTTTENQEVISFEETDGTVRQLNSLFIESENTSLFIRILPGDFILYVPANESRNFDFKKIESIQVMHNLGVKLRWSGQYF